MKRKLFVETITEGSLEYGVIASDVRPATEKKVKEAKARYKKTKKCKHNIIYDEPGWMYDKRYCGICGRGLGVI